MSQLAPLISDLALILFCAGLMTLLFKKLRQPLVLGYIVAGFLAGPHMPYTPSVVDHADVQTWADIGVVFLMFALGLEFSFKKILKVGSTAVIAACVIIFCMVWLGVAVGSAFGWGRMDCLFLGGMVAMSSTTIIYKALDDFGLRRRQFAGMVLGVLVLEDVLAILLMVVLSTVAMSHGLEGGELVVSIGKLLFFIVLWFVVGIYLVPLFLRRCRRLMNDETLLVVSLGLCLCMVVMASKAGFSSAFGAFIMGSILSETVEAESIGRLVAPVKDLFGAVFFVSVGMMVDPAMIVEYGWPILVVTLAVILGQALFGTLGVLLAGQPLKVAMQCGFGLTQIGEFAFIIASLGVSVQVTSTFLYPVVVAVSVITTFLTPYLIRLAGPASDYVDAHLPRRWRQFLEHYASGPRTMNHDSMWRRLILAMVRITVVYSIVVVAIMALSFQFLVPFCRAHLPGEWGSWVAAVATILCMAPFLRSIMIKKNHSAEFAALWNDSRGNRAPLLATIVLRVLLAMAFVMAVIIGLFRVSVGLVFGIAFLLVVLMVLSRQLKKQSILIERRFFQNLHSRDMQAEYLGEKKPEYAGRLLSRDLHLADFVIPGESEWAGCTLAQLGLGEKYGVHVVSILRGKRRINIPGASVRLYPGDKIQVIATDEELNGFGQALERASAMSADIVEKSETILRQFRIGSGSPFLGKNIAEAGIRNKFHCLVVGVEREKNKLHAPNVHEPFAEGDVVWVVGEVDDVYRLTGCENVPDKEYNS